MNASHSRMVGSPLRSSEQLSSKSRGLRNNFRPTSFMFEHRVKNRQEFSHASNQGNLWSFACIAQPLVESANHSVASAGNQSGHVEDCPYSGPAAPDATMASQGAAVTIERRDTDQSRNLLTVELSEFWQLGDKATANHRTDAWHTPEKIFVLLPDWTLTDGLVEFFVGPVQLRFQPADVSVDAL